MPSAALAPTPAASPAQRPSPAASLTDQATSAPAVISAPCAKLKTPTVVQTRLSPLAISA